MPDYIRLSTPDHIELEYQLAGIGTRAAAVLLDHLIQFAVLLVLLIVIGLVPIAPPTKDTLAIIFIFVVTFGYFILFEWLWKGQTPGKRATGLRVMRDDGRPVGLAAAFLRNILRPVDFIPFGYFAAIVSVFANPHLKRLGDLAASTIVVVERRVQGPIAAEFESTASPAGMFASTLSLSEREIAAKFLQRRHEMSLEIRRMLGVKIAAALAERTGYDRQKAVINPEPFLEDIARSV